MGDSLMVGGAQDGHGRAAVRAEAPLARRGPGRRRAGPSPSRPAPASRSPRTRPRRVKGVDFLYTDVWVSMGEDKSVWDERDQAAQAVPGQRGRSCSAPATRTSSSCTACRRSTTATPRSARRCSSSTGSTAWRSPNDVFESERSIVFDQAENRMHTIKAVMVATLGELRTQRCVSWSPSAATPCSSAGSR